MIHFFENNIRLAPLDAELADPVVDMDLRVAHGNNGHSPQIPVTAVGVVDHTVVVGLDDPEILVGAIVVAIGYGAANPAMQSMCMQCETPVRRAVASNTLYIGMDLGLFLGPLLGGFVKDFADYKDVIFIGCIPAVLALVVFLICWPAYEKRIKEITDK